MHPQTDTLSNVPEMLVYMPRVGGEGVGGLFGGCTSRGVYVITRMPGESYRRRLGSLLLYLYYVF